MSNIKQYISELEEITNAIDFKSFSSDEEAFNTYLNKISHFFRPDKIASIIAPLDEINLFRAVSYKKPEDRYQYLHELWHPENKYVLSMDRANFKNQSLLYCAQKQKTAFYETKPSKIGDQIALLTFRIKRELRLYAFDYFDEYSLDTNYLTEKDIALNKFLALKFREKIPASDKHLYYPTAISVNTILQEDHNDISKIDGIIYKSVASDLTDDCITLKPSVFIKHGVVTGARTFKIIEFNNSNDFSVQCISKSNDFDFSNNGKINWDSEFVCRGHKFDEELCK